jgi:serine/threonine-protein kinase RsbW
MDAAQGAEEKLLEEVARFGYTEAATFAIKLALEEAINNAIKHGNRYDPNKVVDLTFQVGPDKAVVTVTDQGDGFDPGSLADPTADENLEKPTGRGVMLMQAYMDEVRFNEKGNQVLMVKRNR